MRLPYIAACAMLAFPGFAEAQQTLQPTWQHVADVRTRGEIKDIELAANGDIVVAGFSRGERGYFDGWVARFDAAGRQLWSKTIGRNPRDELLALALAPDGDIVVSGWRDISSGTALISNGLVARYSPGGDLRWSGIIKTTGSLALYEIIALDNGGVIAAGRHGTRNDTQMHPFMVALDGAGQTAGPSIPTNTPQSQREEDLPLFRLRPSASLPAARSNCSRPSTNTQLAGACA